MVQFTLTFPCNECISALQLHIIIDETYKQFACLEQHALPLWHNSEMYQLNCLK